MRVLAHSASAGWTAWLTDPALLLCTAGATVYLLGRREVRRRRSGSPLVAPARAAWFATGFALLLVALAPPLDRLSDDLFAAHMVQHIVLGLVAPLAFVVSRPLPVLAHGLPGGVGITMRRRAAPLGRRLRRASTWLALLLVTAHVVVFAVWHVPQAYDAAVERPMVHLFEHATLFVTGLGLWWVVADVRWQSRSGVAVLYLFVVGLPMGALAALLTLAPEPIYHAHLATTAEWGLTPLEDQQLAGGIMWVPGGLVYLAVASAMFVRWLGSGPEPGEEVLRWGA